MMTHVDLFFDGWALSSPMQWHLPKHLLLLQRHLNHFGLQCRCRCGSARWIAWLLEGRLRRERRFYLHDAVKQGPVHEEF